jgi:CheY-like chemotaxis protein
LGSIRVLHIDDQDETLVITKKILERIDKAMKIESTTNSCELIEKIRRGSVDCVVVDYKMPGIDGVSLAQRIREFSDVPIIMYTGSGAEEVASTAVSRGVDSIVKKEVDPAHFLLLAKAIRNNVDRYSTRARFRGS